MEKPNIVGIVGPTASGKTKLGIELAQQNNGAIISADSRQVYARLNSGTAKPQAAWRSEAHAADKFDTIDTVPHYLLNIREPNQTYTLSEWQNDAARIIADTIQAGQQPFIVGGTMLYVDSLVYNFDIPAVQPDQKLRGALEQKTTNELCKELIASDPDASTFIEPHHRRRIIRALEVIQITGQPFSKQRQAQPSPYTFELIGLFPGWEELRRRIETRVEEMIKQGLLEETRQLQEKYGVDLPLLNTIHYAQALAIIRGEKNLQEAKDDMIRANLRYAHRQMNWWKRNTAIHWYEKPDTVLEVSIGRL